MGVNTISRIQPLKEERCEYSTSVPDRDVLSKIQEIRDWNQNKLVKKQAHAPVMNGSREHCSVCGDSWMIGYPVCHLIANSSSDKNWIGEHIFPENHGDEWTP